MINVFYDIKLKGNVENTTPIGVLAGDTSLSIGSKIQLDNKNYIIEEITSNKYITVFYVTHISIWKKFIERIWKR